MDLGVWMSPEVLEHKLEACDEKNHEVTWNVARLPAAFTSSTDQKPKRLFVASRGAWRGWFKMADEVLWNPDDLRAPFALIFDASTWTTIEPVRVERFRGVRALTAPPDKEGVERNNTEGHDIPSASA